MNVITKNIVKCNSILKLKHSIGKCFFSFKNEFISFDTSGMIKNVTNKKVNFNISQKLDFYKFSNKNLFGKTKKEDHEEKKILNENEQQEKADKTDKNTDSKETKSKEQETVSLEKYTHTSNLLKDSEENLSKARTKFDELRKMYLELQHDYDRLKKRSEQEVSNAKDFAITKFAKDLLEVTDNFQRALNYLEELKNDNKNNEQENSNKPETEKLKIKLDIYNDFSEGVLITKDNLIKTLKLHGVIEYSPINEKFDPNIHEALVNVPATDKNTPGTVAHVIQTGYKIGTRDLRPAKVAVYKK